MASGKRYAVLQNEDAEKWRGFEKTLGTMFGEPGATWDVYECFNGQLPDMANVDRYAGLLLTGSHYAAYEELPWIRRLEDWIKAFCAAPRRARLVALCFGCQVAAKALGGAVGPNPSGRFVLTVEELCATDALAAKPYFRAAAAQLPPAAACSSCLAAPASSGAAQAAQRSTDCGDIAAAPDPTSSSVAAQPGGDGVAAVGSLAAAGGAARSAGGSASGEQPAGCLRLVESHGDQVLRLPPCAELLAYSATAPYEVWALGERLLAIQGHPELTPQEVLAKIHSTLAGNGRLSREEAAASERALRDTPPDAAALRAMINAFFAGGGAGDSEIGRGADAAAASSSALGGGGGVATSPPAAATAADAPAVAAAAASLPAPAAAAAAAGAGAGGSSGGATLSSDDVGERVAEALAQQLVLGEGAGADSTVTSAAGASAAEAAGAGPTPVTSVAAAERQQHQAALHGLADRLAGELSEALGAQLGGAAADAQLLADMNAAVAGRLGGAAAELRSLPDFVQALQDKQAALGPLLGALDDMEAQVAQLEEMVKGLDAASAALAQGFGAES